MTRHFHVLDMEYMADGPEVVPIALKAVCVKCNQSWVFDASVTDDLMPLEAKLAAAGALVAALEKHHKYQKRSAPGDTGYPDAILWFCVGCGNEQADDRPSHPEWCEVAAALAKAHEAGITGTADEGGR